MMFADKKIIKRTFPLFLLLGLIVFLPSTTYAADYSDGDACTASGAFHQTNDAAGMDFLICDGSNWHSTLYFGSTGGLTISTLTGQPAPSVGFDLGDLGDVDTTGVSDGECITYNNGAGEWQAGSCGGSSLWVTSGSDIYYNSGNVGIGTATPAADLEIHSPAGSFPQLRFGAGAFVLPDYSGSVTVGDVSLTNTFGQLRTYRGGLNNTNKGGLQIQGFTESGINDWVPLYLFGLHGGTAPTQPAVVISGARHNGSDNRAALTGSSPVLDVTNNFSNGTTLLRIQADGNVGIGTTTPGKKVHIVQGADDDSILRVDGLDDSSEYFSIGVNGGNAIVRAGGIGAIDVGMVFQTADAGTETERMRITHDGYVGIGDSSPSVALDVVGDIDYTGVITDVSDRRLKENITPLEDSLEGILALNGYAFTMKDDDSGAVEYGVIAQEVQPVFPALVKTKPDGLMTLNYMGLFAPLIEATKAQQALIDAQQTQIDALRAANTALEERLDKLESRYGTGE